MWTRNLLVQLALGNSLLPLPLLHEIHLPLKLGLLSQLFVTLLPFLVILDKCASQMDSLASMTAHIPSRKSRKHSKIAHIPSLRPLYALQTHLPSFLLVSSVR